jgi:hypothetical protein
MSVRAKAWTALLLPPLSWFVFEQGLSALLHADCSRWQIGAAWGVLSLIVCAIALRLGWTLGRSGTLLADVWLARLAMVVASIFSLAIAFQMLAIAIVPPCLG